MTGEDEDEVGTVLANDLRLVLLLLLLRRDENVICGDCRLRW